MPRNRRMRTVGNEPEVTVFKPRGIPASSLQSVELKVEELEALRLIYVDCVGQVGAAEFMGISQPTFSRLLDEANSKVADALVNGKAILIKGGDYMVETEKGIPKRDGSGKGIRANRGRGGCNPPQDKNAMPPSGAGNQRGRGLGRGCRRGFGRQ